MSKHKGAKVLKKGVRIVNKTTGRALERGAKEVGNIAYGVAEGFLNIFSGNSYHKENGKHRRNGDARGEEIV